MVSSKTVARSAPRDHGPMARSMDEANGNPSPDENLNLGSPSPDKNLNLASPSADKNLNLASPSADKNLNLASPSADSNLNRPGSNLNRVDGNLNAQPSSESLVKATSSQPLSSPPAPTESSSTTHATAAAAADPAPTSSAAMHTLRPGNLNLNRNATARANAEQLDNAAFAATTQGSNGLPLPTAMDLGTSSEAERSQQEGYSILMLAAKLGRVDVVRTCLTLAQSGQREHHPNHRGKDGNNALMLAVEHGHSELACLLIDAGTDLGVVNARLETALAIACKREDVRVADAILEHGGAKSCGLPDKSGTTPLIHAARIGDSALVGALLSCNGAANLEAADEDGHTALTSACQQGRVETVRTLLAAGANVNHRTRDCGTALIFGSHHGSPVITKILLDAGAEVNAANSSGLTAVIQACKRGQSATLKLLISAGADLNASTAQGQTALKLTVVSSVVSLSPCLTQLLEAGVHIGSELHYAVCLGFSHVVEQFLMHGATPTQVATQHLFQAAATRGISSVSPLAVALIFQHMKLAHLFIDSGFLTETDMTLLPNDPKLRAYLKERCKGESLALIKEQMRPWALQVLCVRAASHLIGFDARKRVSRVKVSGLPPAFQRRLSYVCVPKDV